MGLFGSDDNVSKEEVEQYIAEDAGPTVTPERISSIELMLNSDEEVYHMIKPGIVKHGGNKSLTSPGKDSMVAFTDERIAINIGHWMPDDQFTIRYSRIQSVEYESPGVSGMFGVKYFIINTANKEYKIQVGSDVGDLPEIVNWTDKKSAEALTSESSGQKPDSPVDNSEQKSVTDRLEELEGLHEKGIVDDDEYNRKKEELLEEL